jgi:hypothetical protein
VTLPVVVILVFVFVSVFGSPSPSPSSTSPAVLPPLTPSAPPSSAAAAAPCTKLLATLPEELDGLQPRIVHPKPDSVFVVAWGDPAIVLKCGMPRPAGLTPGSSAQLFSANGADGVYWLPVRQSSQTVWTTVDRVVYIQVTVPNSYSEPPLASLARAISAALPRVCVPQAAPGQPLPPQQTLCTHRK